MQSLLFKGGIGGGHNYNQTFVHFQKSEQFQSWRTNNSTSNTKLYKNSRQWEYKQNYHKLLRSNTRTTCSVHSRNYNYNKETHTNLSRSRTVTTSNQSRSSTNDPFVNFSFGLVGLLVGIGGVLGECHFIINYNNLRLLVFNDLNLSDPLLSTHEVYCSQAVLTFTTGWRGWCYTRGRRRRRVWSRQTFHTRTEYVIMYIIAHSISPCMG
jgi:hypothetical protein